MKQVYDIQFIITKLNDQYSIRKNTGIFQDVIEKIEEDEDLNIQTILNIDENNSYELDCIEYQLIDTSVIYFLFNFIETGQENFKIYFKINWNSDDSITINYNKKKENSNKDPFIVNVYLDNSVPTADKTMEEIITAIQEEKQVLMIDKTTDDIDMSSIIKDDDNQTILPLTLVKYYNQIFYLQFPVVNGLLQNWTSGMQAQSLQDKPTWSIQ